MIILKAVINLSYDVDELFRFRENEDECHLEEYLRKNDPGVTEVEIPAEHNGLPVIRISFNSFLDAKYIKRIKIPPSVRIIDAYAFLRAVSLEGAEFSEGLKTIECHAFRQTRLKSVKLPKSLRVIATGAFRFCQELERVEFGGSPRFKGNIFGRCPKLPPETLAMGIVHSIDITNPISNSYLKDILCEFPQYTSDLFRADVFEILAKNNCFRECATAFFKTIADAGKTEFFPLAEKYGMLDRAELVDGLLSLVIENQNTELTAYLLDLKNRKFGFDGGVNFEL